jgi:hypothetical protein
MGEEGGLNLYGYVLNTPVNLTDMLGREPNKPYVEFIDAARDSARDSYNRTTKTGLEAGTVIFRVGDKFVYDDIVDGFKPTEIQRASGLLGTMDFNQCRHAQSSIVTVHSHNIPETKDQINTEKNSTKDIRMAIGNRKPSIVVGHNGDVTMFTPYPRPPQQETTALGNILKP